MRHCSIVSKSYGAARRASRFTKTDTVFITTDQGIPLAKAAAASFRSR